MLDTQPDMPRQLSGQNIRISRLEKALRLEELLQWSFFDITRFNLQDFVLETQEMGAFPSFLEQIADESYGMLHDKRDDLRGRRAREGLMIQGDPDKLARVFDNLLRNAVGVRAGKHADPRSGARRPRGRTTIVFTNRGDRRSRRKSWRRSSNGFTVSDEARSSRTGGAGLGLAIAKQVRGAARRDDHGGKRYPEQYAVYRDPAGCRRKKESGPQKENGCIQEISHKDEAGGRQ